MSDYETRTGRREFTDPPEWMTPEQRAAHHRGEQRGNAEILQGLDDLAEVESKR